MNTDATDSVAQARIDLAAETEGWEKSRFSGGQNGCVELNFNRPGVVGVRDSKLGDASPVLVFTKQELEAWIAGTRDGQFDDRIH